MTVAPPSVATLYERHVRAVWRTLLRLGVPQANIEDAVQDVFLTAHTNQAGFEQRSSARTWLLGIAIRVASNARRSVQRNRLELVSADAPSLAPLQDEQLLQHQRLAVLNKLLEQLPDEQRAVIVLVDLEQLTAPEAAEVVGEKLNTIYSRLRLGRAALSKLLAEVNHA